MSWKKQGGTNRLDATSNVNVNSVVANKFTIKDYFYGDMNVLGNINAEGSMKVSGNLLAAYVGAENIFANLTLKVLRNATIYGSMAVKKDLYVYERQILGNIERNNNIVTLFTNNSITGNMGITQAKIIDSRTGLAESYFDGHLGFGTNNPVATLDVTGNIPLTFAVRTDNIQNYSIISRNNEDTGVVAHTDLATTELQFYKETQIPTDISGAIPDARIQYIEGGILAVEAPDAVITYSKSVLTTRNSDQVVNNSALTVYDIESENGPFAYDVYNSSSSKQSNAISVAGLDSASMSMIHFTNAETNDGISIGGGAYPHNISQRMGTIGYTQPDGTYAPAINIVSSATNRLFHRSTVGINTQYPRTDEYIMDINGPVIIRSTTETTVVQNIPFEMDVLKHCRTDHNYIIAVGKPYTVSGDPDTFYTDNFGSTVVKNYQQKVYFTRDMGQTWNVSDFNDTDIGLLPNNAIHAAYAYDASLCFVCTQRGFMYYSVDGGISWYGIAGLPFSDNIHSVFLTDYFVGSNSVYRVFVCGNTTCTWFDMPVNFYNSPTNFTIVSLNHSSFTFPGICEIADGLDQLMYITVANRIYSFNIGNYPEPLISSISGLNTTGDSYVALSLGSQYVCMFVGPGLITYTLDGGDTYVHLTASTESFLTGKTLNSVFLENELNALISGYDTNGSFFLYSQDQFATFKSITVENLRDFGAPPHVLASQQLYDAFLVSPESIMFFDIVQPYNATSLNRGQSTIYNLYLPHIFTPSGSNRSTSNGAAFRVDYGYAQFGDNVIIEKDVAIQGELSANSASLTSANINGAYIFGQTTVEGPFDVKTRLNLYQDISANGVLITPQQLSYITGVSQDIQTQLDQKLGKSEAATVSGQLTFSGNNTFSGTNSYFGINQFDNLRVAGLGLTTIVSPGVSYAINPTKLSYLRNLTSDVQTQLNDKLSLTAGGSVLNGTYTFNGQINIANTVVVADNSILSPADFGAMKGATSNFQAQLDVMKIAMNAISGGAASAVLDAAMVANVALNTFNVPNRFNKDTTIVGNVIANYATITPTQLSYLSSLTSDIQTQLNRRITLNDASGVDISGAVYSGTGFTTASDISGNTINTHYQVLSGSSSVNVSSQTLTSAQSGSIVNITTGTTLTLPSPVTVGLWFMLYNSSNSNAIVNTPSGLFVPYPDTSSITLLPESTLQIRSNGVNWAVVGGTYDCARLSYPNFSLGDYSTAGSISTDTNLTVSGKAAIGKSAISGSSTNALDVSGNMYVKGNTVFEGTTALWGNVDVSGAATVSNSIQIGTTATVGNSIAIGKPAASPGIELDVSGDAVISSSLAVGRTRNPAFVADISGAIHATTLAIDNTATVGGAATVSGALSVGSALSVSGATTFGSNVGIGKPATANALDVSGSISATNMTAATLTLSGNPLSGFALDMSGNIRAKNITLTDGVGLPSGGVSDSALSTNVALLNRNPQTFSGDNSFKYISVGGATKPTGTTSYAIDISGGLRVMSGSVVLPDGAISALNLPANVCFKDGNNLYLVNSSGTSAPYLGIGKGAMATQYNVDVSGSMNTDGPIYAQKLGINKKGAITAGIDVDISGTTSISNTLNVGQKLTVGSPTIVVASATVSKRSGAYDLYWGTATSANLSIQLSAAFTGITFATRQITYTPYTTAGTYIITYVFDYATPITNHPTIKVYPNYVSPLNPGTGYLITFPATAVQKGTYSVNASLISGMTTGTMYVDIGTIGSGVIPTNLIANTQSVIVRLYSTATTDANTTVPSSGTDAVPLSMNTSAAFNAPTRFAGGVYADTSQTIHFGANAPIMSGSNILPGTIPSTAFASSGVDLGSDQTVLGAKTFANNTTVSSPYKLLVGTSTINANRNGTITVDVSGGIQASQYMTAGTASLFNMVSKRPDNVAFNITDGDVFGVATSSQTVRTYSVNPLSAALANATNIVLPKPFAVSGYYTFTISYVPTVSTDRFGSNVILSAVSGGVVGATLATLNLSVATTASATVYLSSGIQNIRISAPSTVSGLSVNQIGLTINYRYDNSTSLDYKLAVNGDQAVFGKLVPYFGIDGSSTQTINFGTNAPIMSGYGIADGSILDTALSANIARLNSAQVFQAKPRFAAGIDVSGTLTADMYSGSGTGLSGIAKLATDNTFSGNQTMSANVAVSGLTTLNGGLMSATQGGLPLGSDLRLNDHSIYLRSGVTDLNHGLRYEFSLANGQLGSLDGIKLFGFGGGSLSSSNGNVDVLQWTKNNVVLYRPILRNSYYIDVNAANNIMIGKTNLSGFTGSDNIGFGNNALASSTTGSGNVGIGSNALSTSTGVSNNGNNVAIGTSALTACVGSTNTAVGYNAGFYTSGGMKGSNNTFIGAATRVDTSANTYTNSTAIGYGATISASNTIVLGTSAETVRIPGTLNAAIPANNISNATTGSLSITTTPVSCAGITCTTLTTNGATQLKNGSVSIEPNSTTSGVFIYSMVSGSYPYLSVLNSNVSLVNSSNSTSWKITNIGDATFASITSTGLASVSSLSVSGTSTFTGQTTHNGGISASTVSVSGTSTFTGATTHNGGISSSGLSVSGTSTFTGQTTHNGGISASTMSVSGTSTFTGQTTHNGGIVAKSLNVGSGGINATTTQIIDFGSNAPIMSGTNISNIPNGAISDSPNYLRKNLTNVMNYSSGDYFQFYRYNTTSFLFINNSGDIGVWNGTWFNWSISNGGAISSQYITVSGALTASSTGTTLTGTTAINAPLSINTVSSYSAKAPAYIVFDSSLNNIMFGKNNMSYNNPAITGIGNIGIGDSALNLNQTGSYNIGIGPYSLLKTIGTNNIAIGQTAGRNITTGKYNTAIGIGSLAGSTTTDNVNNITGQYNSAIGFNAGLTNAGYSCNTYLGASTDSTGAFYNSTAIGYNAKITASNQIVLGTSDETVNLPGRRLKFGDSAELTYNIGKSNIMFGVSNMSLSSVGSNNIGFGTSALAANYTGYNNIAAGYYSLNLNQSGNNNVGIGTYALGSIIGTHGNTAFGTNALYTNTGSNNTAIGMNADVSGAGINNSTAIGYGAKVLASNQIVLGTSTETTNIPGNLSVSGSLTATVSDTSLSSNIPRLRSTNVFSAEVNTDAIQVTKNGGGGYVFLNAKGEIGYWTGSALTWKMDSAGAASFGTISCPNIVVQNQYVNKTSFQTAASFTITTPIYSVYCLAPTATQTITFPTASATYDGITISFRRTGGSATVAINSASTNILNYSNTLTKVILGSSTYIQLITCVQTGVGSYSWAYT